MAKAIDYFAYDNPFISIKTFFSCKARRKMYHFFVKELHPKAEDQVLDLGVTPDETLEDSNFFERCYPYKQNLTVASIEDCSNLVDAFGLKRFVQNTPKAALPFEDQEFDILFSSAVLEHVGTREDQAFFLKECLRIAKKVFLTTPNRYFPLEMHTFIPFLHWLPWPLFQKIVKRTKNDFWADINNLNLLSKKSLLQMVDDENVHVRYTWTLGMPSNIILYKN